MIRLDAPSNEIEGPSPSVGVSGLFEIRVARPELPDVVGSIHNRDVELVAQSFCST
jgi:hypothetical protein